MSDVAWIDAALVSARPQAVAALLRYFRDLDTAEEAFQEACLRALRNWAENGPPRDPASWLIMVGRNIGIDGTRRAKRLTALSEATSDDADVESAMADEIDNSDYRDDVLRLLFICCHPELPATQQIALALRIVSGLTVPQIARAFLATESAIEQRITRAKVRVAKADVPFAPPNAAERAERLDSVASMIYLLFNEGYSATGGDAGVRQQLCDEAIRLARLLSRLFRSEPEIMGLTALMLLQHSRSEARLDEDGAIVLLEKQDRSRWNRKMIAEGVALLEKAFRHHTAGPYQVQAAIAAVHAAAAKPDDTDWAQIDVLYATLEHLTPSPVITLNRAVAVSKVRGAQAAFDLIAPLEEQLESYFHYYGVRGAFLKQLGRDSEARDAWNRAISLAHSTSEAAYIRDQINQLQKESPVEILGVVPYLLSKDAKAASEFYKKAFGAEEVGAAHHDNKGRYMHIHLRINGGSLMLSDAFPEHGHPWQQPQGFTLTLSVKDIDAWWKRAVDAGCTVVTPVQKMFWGDRYGSLTDPFGTQWAMNEPSQK